MSRIRVPLELLEEYKAIRHRDGKNFESIKACIQVLMDREAAREREEKEMDDYINKEEE